MDIPKDIPADLGGKAKPVKKPPKMPRALPRTHFQPSWRGDRLAAINVVSKMKPGPDGLKAIDMNFQWGQHKAWNLHWPQPWLNNYRFYLEPGAGKARRMTRAELRRPIDKWTDAQIARWRRTRDRRSEGPHSYLFCVEHAYHKGVIVVAELKSPEFATHEAAQYMVHSAKSVGHRPYFMALLAMSNCRGKARAIDMAGGQFAVIFGKFAKRQPKDWDQWKHHVTQVWGANWDGK